MAAEHTYYCESPDCDSHIRSAYEPPRDGWLYVVEHYGDSRASRDFCGWECAMRFAATLPQPETLLYGTE